MPRRNALLVLLLTLIPVARAWPACSEFIARWEAGYEQPRAIAMGSGGRIFVLEDRRMHIHDDQGNRTDGWLLVYAGSVNGLALDGDGNAYVSTSAGDVRKYNGTGQLVATFGTYGSGDGQFLFPAGIALDGEGRIFVADVQGSRIQRFSAAGEFEKKWGSFGDGTGRFTYPRGLAVDRQGNVLVSDQPWSDARIQVFTGEGAFIREITLPGCDAAAVPSLPSFALDPYDNIYAVRYNFTPGVACLQQFDPQGSLVCTLGSYGADEGQFMTIVGVAPDGSGHVYVMESLARRVHKFRMDLVPVEPATWGGVKTLFR